jgi:FMN-dependent NADH-azoreductase
MEAGKTTEDNKFITYGNALRDNYHFVPIVVETFGSLGSIGHKFITEIGRTISGITKNPKSTSFIFKQYQWQFSGAMYNVSKVPMVNLHLKSLMKSFISYMNKKNVK